MRSVQTFKVTCLFCGRARQGEVISDDGYDWEGHHRGTPSSERYLEKCTCKIGQLVNSLPPIKKMCLNCLSYKGRFCTNAKQIEKVRKMVSQFEINLPKLAVKDPTGCCDEHELDYHIFGELIKDGKEK